MAVFAVYFLITLLALIIRGYYRVPPTCIVHEIIDKDENTMKSLIADRMECKCHYTNFLWNRNTLSSSNQTYMNISMKAMPKKRYFETTALVRN